MFSQHTFVNKIIIIIIINIDVGVGVFVVAVVVVVLISAIAADLKSVIKFLSKPNKNTRIIESASGDSEQKKFEKLKIGIRRTQTQDR